MKNKTLIITDSNDATTDLLIHYLGSEKVFRLNYDLWSNYSIRINSDNFEISTKYNTVNIKEISKVYWRKPFNSEFVFDSKIDKYLKEEVKYIFREIFNLLKINKKTILTKPLYERECGKIAQLIIAKNYFDIPEWFLSINNEINYGNYIIKSLSSEPLSEREVLYTKKTNGIELNNKYPWFVQNLINGTHDVTVVHVDNKNFAFKLDRALITDVDWRKEINEKYLPWEIFQLPKKIDENINLFMKKLNLKFSRIDFIFENEKFYFLEVNPNGQYAWLDLKNENGLLSEILSLIDPNTEIRALVQ